MASFILFRHQPVALHQPPDVFGDHVFHPRGVDAAEVEDGFYRFHLHPRAGEFKAARADAGLQEADHGAQPVWHPAQRHAASGAGGVF